MARNDEVQSPETEGLVSRDSDLEFAPCRASAETNVGDSISRRSTILRRFVIASGIVIGTVGTITILLLAPKLVPTPEWQTADLQVEDLSNLALVSQQAAETDGPQLDKHQTPQAQGPCTNAHDLAIFHRGGSYAFDHFEHKCATDCWGGGVCATKCFMKEQGYSQECATCFGGLPSCTMSECLFPCTIGGGPACSKCSHDRCLPLFKTCSGFEWLN